MCEMMCEMISEMRGVRAWNESMCVKWCVKWECVCEMMSEMRGCVKWESVCVKWECVYGKWESVCAWNESEFVKWCVEWGQCEWNDVWNESVCAINCIELRINVKCMIWLSIFLLIYYLLIIKNDYSIILLFAWKENVNESVKKFLNLLAWKHKTLKNNLFCFSAGNQITMIKIFSFQKYIPVF